MVVKVKPMRETGFRPDSSVGRWRGTELVMQNLALYEISAKENGAGQHSPRDVDPSGGAVSPLALGFRNMYPLVQLLATLGPS